jgi:hypothetical protein
MALIPLYADRSVPCWKAGTLRATLSGETLGVAAAKGYPQGGA